MMLGMAAIPGSIGEERVQKPEPIVRPDNPGRPEDPVRMQYSSTGGYCNWNGCDGESQGGDWCNKGKCYCENGCGTPEAPNGCNGQWCDGPQPSPLPPAPSPPSPLPPAPSPPSPTSLTATTTRYWDCSGGACACSYVPKGQDDKHPVHCHSNAMFAAPAGNTYGAKFYGNAAISKFLGGQSWMAENCPGCCEKCWKATATCNVPGCGGVQTTLVLKGNNNCPDSNDPCREGPHFDIAAPGFDYAGASDHNTCSEVDNDELTGFKACSRWMIDSDDPSENCNCDAFKDPILKTGCKNFLSLGWNNPTVSIEPVTCPKELMELHCGMPYAKEEDGIPDTCQSNIFTDQTANQVVADIE
ncbi:hypothetical protein ACHAWF_012548 [Thalassiosira exigua]